MDNTTLRRTVSFSVVIFFLIYVLSRGIGVEVSGHKIADSLGLSTSSKINFPDFSQYLHVRALSAKELSLASENHRAIVVGDIHGQSFSLQAFLLEVNYHPERDRLIHTGDIIVKGTLAGSRTVLSYMTKHNVTGVRGNHDQMVLEWRAWIEWVQSFSEGRTWLATVEQKWMEDSSSTATTTLEDEEEDGEYEVETEGELDPEEWIETQKGKVGKGGRKWWDRIPKGWKMFSDHYKIARGMTSAEYDYLRSLPLILHLPSEHTFIVHAGLLPYDPTRSITSQRQPLARLPDLLNTNVKASTAELREAQESAVLTEIKQNTDPWVILNVRNILHNKSLSKSTKHGAPWTGSWNSVMPRCVGYEKLTHGKSVVNDKFLPCHPSTVIYGHTASRGLDVHRWTVGLDSGCVYGRKLTGLVLDKAHRHKGKPERADDPNESRKATISFGDDGQARLVSVQCHKHKEKKGKHGQDKLDDRSL
ncbi:Metallo-dependent phosphatase-like protein [Amylostereum chailletii]|nr:Metallo-dependent phosphatase-like protein [Amylostereum chailletii]